MKSKYLALGLSALLILSLASCGGQQTPKPEEPKQEVQQAEPISAQPVIAPEEVKQEIMPTASEQLQEITHDELIEVFEKEYEISKGVYNSDSEDTIQGELLAIQFTVDSMDKSLPSDYEAQYRAWRPSVAQQQAPAQAQALTFTEVNEQVWVTGTVNLRSDPSTDNDKVGSLNKGNSVTRVGIGTGDYVDWSRVQLSDGRIVYVASSYLTTTKPATQTQSGGGTTTTQTQTQTQTKPSGGTPQQSQGTPQGNYTSDGVYMGVDPSQVYDTTKSTEESSPNPWDGAELPMNYGS